MSKDDEMLVDVRNWLSQNGYVLEMEVARKLLPYCPLVFQGSQYTDSVTGKLRETDVLAVWLHSKDATVNGRKSSHRVDLIVECKNTSAPWVAFYGGSKKFQRDAMFPCISLGGDSDCDLCDFPEELYEVGPGDEAPTAYSIMEKKTKGDRDLARDAVLAAASAAVSAVLETKKRFDEKPENKDHVSHQVLPVVVTKSPIFACSLDDAGEVKLSRISSSWVQASHELHEYTMRTLVMEYAVFDIFASKISDMCRRSGFYMA